jgi:hypothetical protein
LNEFSASKETQIERDADLPVIAQKFRLKCLIGATQDDVEVLLCTQ